MEVQETPLENLKNMVDSVMKKVNKELQQIRTPEQLEYGKSLRKLSMIFPEISKIYENKKVIIYDKEGSFLSIDKHSITIYEGLRESRLHLSKNESGDVVLHKEVLSHDGLPVSAYCNLKEFHDKVSTFLSNNKKGYRTKVYDY